MELRELESTHDKAASYYYSMCEKKEAVDNEIQRAIQDHDKGDITFTQVQKVSDKAFKIKKDTETAYHSYVESIQKYNE